MTESPKTAIIVAIIGILGTTMSAFIGGQGIFFNRQSDSPVAAATSQLSQPQQPAPPTFQPLIPTTQAAQAPVATSTAIEQTSDVAADESTSATFTDEPVLATRNDIATTSELDPLTTLQLQVEQANEKLNLVWNAASHAARQKILAEQRTWLKKRELDCKLQSLDVAPHHQDQQRLICERDETNQRVSTLRQALEHQEILLAQQQSMPNEPTSVPTVATTSSSEDEITQRIAAQNAAKMQQNMRHLEQQLRNF